MNNYSRRNNQQKPTIFIEGKNRASRISAEVTFVYNSRIDNPSQESTISLGRSN